MEEPERNVCMALIWGEHENQQARNSRVVKKLEGGQGERRFTDAHLRPTQCRSTVIRKREELFRLLWLFLRD